ncbi:MAG: transporter substrate-binding domain-containing protein [Ruminococcus sp.]|nr:transporter substrate-binding domain-containing protein [Ruminococcus sp.]
MKKLIALFMAAAMSASVLAGCGGSSSTESNSEGSTGDWSYIEEKGDFVIGITYFEPMNYLDDSGELTGFETEFATKVCEEMGVTPKFQKIDWDSKEVELNAKTIDCIWNGLTITDERKENMDISTPYMENKQVMVVKADKASEFSADKALTSNVTVVAEKKSAGEDVAKEEEYFADANYVSVDSQAKALLEVKSGTADVAIIDYVMSIGTLRDGSDYADLTVVEDMSFAPEQYGIAIRKNSTETLEKLNAAIQKLADNGELDNIADEYNLKDLLLVEKSK